MRLRTKAVLLFTLGFLVAGLSIILITRRVIETVLIQEVGKRGMLKTEDLPLATAMGFQIGDEHALIPVLQKGLERTGATYAVALNIDGHVLAQTGLPEKE